MLQYRRCDVERPVSAGSSPLLAVAGDHVFMLGDVEVQACGAHGDHDTITTGGIGDDAMLAALPPATLDAMLAQLSADFLLDDTPTELTSMWPHHIEVEVVHPDFSGRTPKLVVVGLVDVSWPASSGWRGYMTHTRAEVELPAWSSLYPPPAAVELARFVRGKRVIGWSRTLAAPAPAPDGAP